MFHINYSELSSHLQNLQIWIRDNHLRINKKTECMYFYSSKKSNSVLFSKSNTFHHSSLQRSWCAPGLTSLLPRAPSQFNQQTSVWSPTNDVIEPVARLCKGAYKIHFPKTSRKHHSETEPTDGQLCLRIKLNVTALTFTFRLKNLCLSPALTALLPTPNSGQQRLTGSGSQDLYQPLLLKTIIPHIHQKSGMNFLSTSGQWLLLHISKTCTVCARQLPLWPLTLVVSVKCVVWCFIVWLLGLCPGCDDVYFFLLSQVWLIVAFMLLLTFTV